MPCGTASKALQKFLALSMYLKEKNTLKVENNKRSTWKAKAKEKQQWKLDLGGKILFKGSRDA